MAHTHAIELRSVTKHFATSRAVADLSLVVPKGAVYGLLGPNGAGKTTTIRMILDIIAPDSGEVRLLGTSNRESGILDRVGYLPEERGLYRKMSVRRVLRFLAALKGLSRREADRRIDEWMERLSLVAPGRDLATAKVEELSRGMQQKVQFIGALVHDPEILILDEPFSGLDPINAQALKDAVIDFKRMGKTIVFSTHLMDNAERMCDAVCIIANGEKVLDGPVAAVRDGQGRATVALALEQGSPGVLAGLLTESPLVHRVDDHNRYFEVELARGADPQALLRDLVGRGVALRRFELVQPSLHQIFLKKVGAHGVEEGMSGQG